MLLTALRFSVSSSKRSALPKNRFSSPRILHLTTTRRWHSPTPTSSRNEEIYDDQPELKTLLGTNGVLTLTLNRPRQRNALNGSLLTSLHRELETAGKIPEDIRVILLQAEGRVFSSGHDIKELMNLDKAGQGQMFELCSEVMQLLVDIPQPTICAVEGLAVAAGCQLVASCALVVGDPRSGYATPGAKTIGLFCHTPAVPLVRCIGLKKALDMLYTGRTITASEALQYGLITHTAANPRREAMKLAEDIASQSTFAMQSGKRTFYQQVEAQSLKGAYQIASTAMVENLQTKDTQYGLESFLRKGT